MLPLDQPLRPWALAIVVALGSLGGAASIAADPVRIRVEPLTVPPATQPLISVVVRNLQEDPCAGHALNLRSCRLADRAGQPTLLELAAGAEKRLAFNIERARNVEANAYPFTIQARVGDRLVRCEQSVFVASAPYSKATVDGQPDEWQDAIPVSFEQQGKRSDDQHFLALKAFRTLLVAVQEQQHVGYTGADGPPGDAVQLAISSLEPPDAAGVKERPRALSSSWRRRVARPSVSSWPPGTRRKRGPVKHRAWSPWCAAMPRRQSCGTARRPTMNARCRSACCARRSSPPRGGSSLCRCWSTIQTARASAIWDARRLVDSA